jgi:hypothetical protein
VWAMWAIKNFVHGPSAAVTFGARPYPPPIKQTATGHRPPATGQQPYRTLQCSTLVGGHVGSVHMTRWLAGAWPCGHVAMTMRGHLWVMWAMYPRFFFRSQTWGLAPCYQYLQLTYNFKVMIKVLYLFAHMTHKVRFSLLDYVGKIHAGARSQSSHNRATQ